MGEVVVVKDVSRIRCKIKVKETDLELNLWMLSLFKSWVYIVSVYDGFNELFIIG